MLGGRSSERESLRLGGEGPVTTDVRVIAATNRDLREEIRSGRFREDLYYRLSALVIPLPALRERPEDVPLLARHFLARRAQGAPRIAPAAERLLADQPWPGNIRQLESVLARALLLFGSPDRVTADEVRRALEVERSDYRRFVDFLANAGAKVDHRRHRRRSRATAES